MSDSVPGVSLPSPRRKKHLIREYIEAALVAIALTLLFRTFVVQAFRIPSGSMEETLLVGDYLFVNKMIYGAGVPFSDRHLPGWREPERGDVAVFEFPKNRKRDFIKRIIGVPGDHVELKNARVYINGEPAAEPYLKLTASRRRPPDAMQANIFPKGSGNKDFYGPVTVPEGHYFVLGDNRDSSEDSRYWGFLPRELLKGKAVLIYMSFDADRNPRFGRFGKVVS